MTILLTILGLAAFEVISSIDNAVINAEVLGTMHDARVRRFFTTWGILFAVFFVRGLLPLLIVYAVSPGFGLLGAAAATFSDSGAARAAIEAAAPSLLMAGGAFLVLLFVHWLLVEDKAFGLPHEEVFSRVGQVWFYAVAPALLVAGLVGLSHVYGPRAVPIMLAAAVGFAAFFVTQGFKEHAEAAEAKMRDGVALGDWAKVLFLEVIDMAFSVDGVVGAFAFTTAVPLILAGNGIGAIVVRQLTVGNVERIKRYPYLKNGAMYSIGALAVVMVLEGFGVHVPAWVSPAVTFACIGFHLSLSVREMRRENERSRDEALRSGVGVGSVLVRSILPVLAFLLCSCRSEGDVLADARRAEIGAVSFARSLGFSVTSARCVGRRGRYEQCLVRVAEAPALLSLQCDTDSKGSTVCWPQMTDDR